jgi:hypothetical protein
MRPRKNPSNVITPANASRVRMFGAARRSNVGRIGPSSSSLVRAAADGVTPLAGANEVGEIEALPLFIGNSCPYREDWRSAWAEYLERPSGCAKGPDGSSVKLRLISSVPNQPAKHHFSHKP